MPCRHHKRSLKYAKLSAAWRPRRELHRTFDVAMVLLVLVVEVDVENARGHVEQEGDDVILSQAVEVVFGSP